jgi:hypothetical protein
MPILDTVLGWSLEEGDPVILMGEECELVRILDDNAEDHTLFLVRRENQDEEEVKIFLNTYYDIWGN